METFRKCFVEFIGTFFLVATVGLTAVSPANHALVPLAIGFVLMVMVYAGGYISGGHYNPAVSLAAAIRGGLSPKNCALYMVSQIFGSVLASILIMSLIGATPRMVQCPFSLLHIAIGEFLFTFALCYVVLTTATSKVANNSYYGLAIGSTVFVGAVTVGGVLCYGAFNPAVAIGLTTMNLACLTGALFTIGINLVAAVAAAYTYKLVDANHE